MTEIRIVAAPEQKAVFTFNSMDGMETDMVSDLVSWRNFDRWGRAIYDIHGRSLVLRSPSRHNLTMADAIRGEFSGLQVYGAGGSLGALGVKKLSELDKGVGLLPDSYLLSPVDPADHSKELYQILEQRRIDENGQIHFWNRPYAPLHGMDKKEADRRKLVTVRFREELGQGIGSALQLTVPEFVSDGFFPEKLDPDGNPLRFQVYRVPLVPRFHNQIGRESSGKNFENVLMMLGEGSFLLGRGLRFAHDELDLAYMDDHIANLSMIRAGEYERVLYMTDLGSMQDIGLHPYKTRYTGFDFYSYIDSVYRFLSEFTHRAYGKGSVEMPLPTLNKILRFNAISGLMQGYYRPELMDRFGGEIAASEEVQDKLGDWSNSLLLGFETSRGLPGFMEFFETFDSFLKEAGK